MRCTNTSVAAVAQVSTETLDVLVGLCAGQGPHFVSSERTWQSFSEVCLIPKVTLFLVMRETGQQKSGSSITGEITGELFIVSL